MSRFIITRSNTKNMSEKDIPIVKKKVKELMKGMSWAERLKILEPLAEHCRRMSRKEVYSKDIKKGLDDYPI